MCTCVDAQGEEVYVQFIFIREDAALLILIEEFFNMFGGHECV